MSWLSRLANAFRGGCVDRELDDELRFHLEARTEELMRSGVSAGEARRQARERLGNDLALRERSRDIRLAPWLESLWRDLRYGLRVLWKDRVVTLAAVLSLGLALGACTAAFALIDAMILRPLPVSQPERLVYLSFRYRGPEPGQSFSYPMLQRLQAASGAQIELFAASNEALNSAAFGNGEEEKVRNQFVSGNFFRVLGIVPALGRLLSPADDSAPGSSPVAVLSYSFWMRRFGGSPSVLGSRFQLGGKPYRIVGVARKGFDGIEPGIRTDFWLPQAMVTEALGDWSWNWFRILGRLQPGVTRQQAQQVLQAAFTNARRDWAPQAFGPNDAPERIQQFLTAPLYVRPAAGGPSDLRRDFARPMWLLAAVAGLVLLIACSNLTNLFTARAAARQREMALRISIGAGRARLVQQVLVEGALLASAACVLGFAFGAAVAPAIVGMLGSSRNPVYLDLQLTWRLVGFTTAAGVLSALLFALAPALRASGVAPQEALKGGGKHSARSALLRPVLAAQVGIGFAVLFVSGLFLASFVKLVNLDLGFSGNGVVLFTLAARSGARNTQVAEADLLDRVRALPGVRSAGMSEWGLFSGSGRDQVIRIPGRAPDPALANVLPISPRFFQTMGMRLLAGRDLNQTDMEKRSGAVVVNEAFARHYFPGEDPLRKRFTWPAHGSNAPDVPEQIVGLVRDAHYGSVRDPAPPTMYLPMEHLRGTLAVRAAGDPLRLIPAVRQAVRGFGPALEISEVVQQSTLVNNALLRERLLAVLSGFFAVVAVLLAAVGLYGVLSYSVVRRTREIGIRVALGARQSTVVRMVVAEIALATAAGSAGGLAAGEVLARSAAKLLYEVKPTGLPSIALPLASLLAAAAIAALRPAVRAARVDPAVALRED